MCKGKAREIMIEAGRKVTVRHGVQLIAINATKLQAEVRAMRKAIAYALETGIQRGEQRVSCLSG